MKLGSKYNLLNNPPPPPPANYRSEKRSSVKVLGWIDFWKYALSTIIYLMQSSENGYQSNFFMHIFHMSVTYLHSVENIQWKL